MRIIAGELKSLEFKSPNGHATHPMSDKVRGALFNVLGEVSGLTLLDAFAGSGAVSFEGISRGVKSAVAVDADAAAYKTIITNAKQLKIDKDRLRAIHANCFTWSNNHPEDRFDLVIADPPYEAKRLNHRHVFKMFDHVRPQGLFVVSIPPAAKQMTDFYAKETPNLEEVILKDYGDAQLVFYRKVS